MTKCCNVTSKVFYCYINPGSHMCELFVESLAHQASSSIFFLFYRYVLSCLSCDW